MSINLFDWQQKIVDNIKDKSSYGLFLDCGLGKTPVSLKLAEMHNCNKLLIVSINSKVEEDIFVQGSWLSWIDKLDYPVKSFVKKDYTPTNGAEALVINYESLYDRKIKIDKKSKSKTVPLNPIILSFIDNIKMTDRFCMIIDESHRIKNHTSKTFKACDTIKRKVLTKCVNKYYYLLTGTPFTQGYFDLWAQLNFLGCPMTIGRFKERFCILGRCKSLKEWEQPIVDYKDEEGLFDLVHHYAITIKQKEVVKLPEELTVECVLPKEKNIELFTKEKIKEKEVKEHSSSKKLVPNPFYRNILFPDDTYFADTAGTMWLRSREISIGFIGNADGYIRLSEQRSKFLKDLLSEYEDNYIIFYNYVPELIEIFDVCNELGYKVDVYSGTTKDLSNYNKFETLDPIHKELTKKLVIIANYASGSTGKNWQSYNKVIQYSLPLFKDWTQCLARVHRIGQDKPTTYYIIHQDNWVENDMYEKLKNGINYSEDLFEGGLMKANEN